VPFCWKGFWNCEVVVVVMLRWVVRCVDLGRRARRVVRARDSIVGVCDVVMLLARGCSAQERMATSYFPLSEVIDLIFYLL
jgi:hypothetical protein